MKKRKNIFKPLVEVEAKNTHIKNLKSSENERWVFGILPGDKRIKFFFSICAVLLFFLLSRAFYLQVVRGRESLNLAQNNRFTVQEIRAPRGLFFDRNREVLVKNIPNYEVTVMPNDLPKTKEEREKIYKRLSETINVETEKIKIIAEEKSRDTNKSLTERLSYTQPLVISSSVSQDTALIFESRQSELRGFYVGINPIREYLDNGLLAHVFGYVGRISEEEYMEKENYNLTDYIGKTGLEKEYEQILKGQDSYERIERDSSGEIIRTYGQQDPILGDNLMLSIDFGLQKKLTEELTRQMERAKVKKAAAVAVNPQNGEVLAYVSLPTYDNNLFAKGISSKNYEKFLNDINKPLIDRIISGEYPSGSTIKPYIAAAALEEGIINKSTTVLSTGGISIGEWSFPDWKGGGHGVTNVIKAIAESVNTFFYAIGGGYKNITGLGPTKMKEYLERFGFGNYIGIDIDGEAKGRLPDEAWKQEVKGEPWYLGDTYHMAIGQGDVLVTPIQMVNALSVVANGGTMYKLHFLKSVIDSEGNVKSEKSPEIVKNNFMSSSSIQTVREGMRATATSGSGRSLASLPVSSAGKTGTAQYGPNNENKHAWFTTFAPYENPEIAMVVLLEGAGEGSDFAVPVAKETLKWYFSR